MIVTCLLIIAGLVLLFFGGEMLVSGAVDIAKKLGMSQMMIGITLVGFGTSTPELVTSLIAVYQEKPGISVGNVVGSNTANILLILGVAALIYPIACDKKGFLRDGGFMMLSSILCLLFIMQGAMGMITGALFLAALVTYIGLSFVMEKKGAAANETEEQRAERLDIAQYALLKNALYFIAGLIMTFIGAKFLVDGSVDIARDFGVDETIIGLTIVAVGTSLPEMAASCIAAFKKQADIAYGNIIGSNIYNILGILGITALLHPFTIPAQIITFDIWVMLGATALLMLFSAAGWKIGRAKGAVFLAGYVAYTLTLIHLAGGF